MKIELDVPGSLSDIKLLQYQAFLKANEIYKGNPEKTTQLMTQYLCGIDLKDQYNLPLREVESITNTLNDLFNKEEFPFIQRFYIGKIEFGFIPKFEDISLGEYIDLDATISDMQELHRAMAIMYRPIINKPKLWKRKSVYYEIEPYNSEIPWAEVMKHAPLDAVLGALFFFQTLGQDLLKSTTNYLEDLLENPTFLQQPNLDKSGDGILRYGDLLKEISQSLKMLQD